MNQNIKGISNLVSMYELSQDTDPKKKKRIHHLIDSLKFLHVKHVNLVCGSDNERNKI